MVKVFVPDERSRLLKVVPVTIAGWAATRRYFATSEDLATFKADRAGDLIFNVSWNRDTVLLPGFANNDEVMLLHISREDIAPRDNR